MAKQQLPKRQINEFELRAHLIEQVGFLEASAAAYDADMTGEAKRLAATTRTLVHETKKSKALLHQLKLTALPFITTAVPYNRNNLLTHFGLVAIRMDDTGYVALGDVSLTRQASFEVVERDRLQGQIRQYPFSKRARPHRSQ